MLTCFGFVLRDSPEIWTVATRNKTRKGTTIKKTLIQRTKFFHGACCAEGSLNATLEQWRNRTY